MKPVMAAAVLLAVGYPSDRLSAQSQTSISEAQSVLSPLIESYGVSGVEGPVRETVKRFLPAWAKSETDTAGNLWVRLGQGISLTEAHPQVASVREIPWSCSWRTWT